MSYCINCGEKGLDVDIDFCSICEAVKAKDEAKEEQPQDYCMMCRNEPVSFSGLVCDTCHDDGVEICAKCGDRKALPGDIYCPKCAIDMYHKVSIEVKPSPSKAHEFLKQGMDEMIERESTYDAPGGERSMAKTVAMFNAMTGFELTEQQGWKFMVCLKLVRSEQGDFRADNFVDGAAYFGLAGETASNKE